MEERIFFYLFQSRTHLALLVTHFFLLLDSEWKVHCFVFQMSQCKLLSIYRQQYEIKVSVCCLRKMSTRILIHCIYLGEHLISFLEMQLWKHQFFSCLFQAHGTEWKFHSLVHTSSTKNYLKLIKW